jgi:hypothetical protein
MTKFKVYIYLIFLRKLSHSLRVFETATNNYSGLINSDVFMLKSNRSEIKFLEIKTILTHYYLKKIVFLCLLL